jgi:transcriptional regulator with XRE-family HTH domain
MNLELINIAIPETLKYWREKANISQAEVSEALKMPIKTYQAYEEGRSEPSIKTLLKLKSVFHCNTIEEMLFPFEEPMKSYKDKLFENYRKASIEKRKIIDFILNC